MANPALDVADGAAGVSLIPIAVQILGRVAELDNQIAGEILRLDLAPLFLPEPDHGGLVGAHDDPGVGAADEGAAAARVLWGKYWGRGFVHSFLRGGRRRRKDRPLGSQRGIAGDPSMVNFDGLSACYNNKKAAKTQENDCRILGFLGLNRR